MEKWYVSAKKADFDGWAEKFRITPVLARILRNRGLTDEEQVRRFLWGSLEDCYSPWLLKDMEKAVDLILSALKEKVYFRVIGDYDVDGICSSYLLTRALELLGARVDTAIPHRIHDGYGLNDHLIQEAAQAGVEMILTCDNGIAAAPQIEMAGRLGIRVIVTDHHEVPFEIGEDGSRRELLPPASAVIDPKQTGCAYPFPGICGSVVAYKLVCALAEKSGSAALKRELGKFLELAALATVCDVMELKDENRILVKEGLMRSTENPGLRALVEVNGLNLSGLTAYHLGFVVGPCLNAAGRLDTAKRALELLQSASVAEAMSAARELKELNDSRKDLTARGVEQAKRYILEHGMESDKVMVVFLPEVHESLAGIIAGRIREQFGRPVFLLTRGDGVKGSGRSIEGYHMYDAMTRVKEYFTRFGGHAMAAGLSMREEDIEPLRRALNESCTLTEEDFIPKVHIDVPMPLDYSGAERIAEELELLEPFGVGNPKPLFAQKDLEFCAGSLMGANRNCARYRVRTPEGSMRQLLFFGDLERFHTFLEERYGPGSAAALYQGEGHFRVSAVYQLGKNTFRGKTEIQYVMQYFC